MKVLFHIPHPILGGGETQLKYLVKYLSPDINVAITYAHAVVEPLFEAMRGVSIRRAGSTADLVQAISSEKPDVIQFYDAPAMYDALRRLPRGRPRPRVCEVAHNRARFQGDLTSYGKDRTDVVVCVSHDVQRHVKARLPRVSTAVIPNGVDSEIFFPAKKKALRSRPLGGFTGRLEPGDEKGIWSLVRVVAALPVDFELVGADRGGYAERIRAARVENVSVLPFTSNPADCYQRWDFFASRSPIEGFGMSIAEAMACGLPSVIFRCGGISSYLEHEKHALIAKSDRQMSEFIQRIIEGVTALDPCGIGFGADRMAAAYEGLYARLLEARTSRSWARQ